LKSYETAGRSPLRAWSYTCDTVRNTALQQREYTQTDDFFVYYTQPLDTSIAEPPLPAGYMIRHIQSDADIAERAAVHRAAFAPSKMTEAIHRAVMTAPTYRADLDLVVVAPDGDFAAFALVWYDAANYFGTFEPVGCHPDHQRKGLARAVLREGMRRVQRLGGQLIHVNS